MSWFQDFVDVVVEAWPSKKEKLIQEGVLVKKAKLTSKETGGLGENHIINLLSSLGYTTAKPKGSKSPADVWGVDPSGSFVHIALVQVKTAVIQNVPSNIGEEEEKELAALADLTWDLFDSYTGKPESYPDTPLVVSCGYAGVVGGVLKQKIHSARFIKSYYSERLINYEDQLKPWLRKFHKLQ